MHEIEHAARRLMAGQGASLAIEGMAHPVNLIASTHFSEASTALYVFAPRRLPVRMTGFRRFGRLALVTSLYRPREAAELAQKLNLLMDVVETYMTEIRADADTRRIAANTTPGQRPRLMENAQ